MVKKTVLFLGIILLNLNVFCQLHYPVTKKGNQLDNYFGTQIKDPYRWLENDTSKETKSWVSSQQKFTEKYMSSIPYRSLIEKHLEKTMNYSRYFNGFKVGEYIFFEKNDGLQNQSVYYYQKGPEGKPEVFLDPNLLSMDGSVSVVLDGPSNDKKYMGYHINRNGSDWCTAYVMEIATHRVTGDSIHWLRDMGAGAWVDNGFYYTGYPKPEKGKELTAVARNPRIYFHKLGDNVAKDKLIFEDTKNPDYLLGASTTEDGKFLFIYKSPADNVEVYGKRLDKPDDLKLIFKGYNYQYQIIGNLQDTLFIMTNDHADNFRVTQLIYGQDAGLMTDVIAEKKEKLENSSMVGRNILNTYLKDAVSEVNQYNSKGELKMHVTLPGLGNATGFNGYKEDSYVLFDFSSFTFPPGIYQYNLADGHIVPFKTAEFPGDLNSYTTDQVFFTSKDGTRVPMFIVHRKNMKLNGSHPLLLYAYGGFDISLIPRFNPIILELLNNNGIYVMANLRGGGEYGEAWHKAGMLANKQNVFDDFIAASDYLVANKYTSRNLLAVMGGSNGGLLIGAVITQQPNICKVAFPEVGVMDMLRFQKFTSGVFWTSEYGSSDSAKQFPILLKYSPVHNIKEHVNYPATLVMTADHDDRVVPMHSYKFIATLQDKQAGKAPVLIRISTNQGHGASGSSLKKNLENWTDIYSFMFYNMKINPRP